MGQTTASGQSIQSNLKMSSPLGVFVALLIGLGGCGQEYRFEKIYPKRSQECEESSIAGEYLVQWTDGSLTFESKESEEDLYAFLEKNEDRILFVERDQWLRQESDEAVLDSHSSSDWAIQRIGAKKVWDQELIGRDVTIAVIDSGVDLSHAQLQGQFALNPKEIPNNWIDDDHNGLIDDVSGWDFFDQTPLRDDDIGHGTHIAGIILARHDQGSVKGVAPGAKLLPIKFMDSSGTGRLTGALEAINYAASMGVEVINASWGGSFCSLSLKSTISQLEGEGILFVSAAGNNHVDIDTYPEYPAAYNLAHQVTVGASDLHDQIAPFSNIGIERVHILAPGTSISSLYPVNSFSIRSGTSMAAPFVAGSAALLYGYLKAHSKTIHKRELPALVKKALLESVDLGTYSVQSSGRLNVHRALDRLTTLLNQETL